MDLENLGFQMEEDILEFILQPQFKDDIENAREYFYNSLAECNINDEMMLDFNSWLMFDYKLKDGESFFQKYFKTRENQLTHEEREWLKEKTKSFLSLYELREKTEKEGLLRDIFTKEEFWVDLSQISRMDIRDLILARAAQENNKQCLFGSKVYIPGIFKNSIERNMLNQYEAYINKTQYGNWKDFLKKNSVLLYKYLGIILDVMNNEEANEENYDVWQSTYLIKDTKKIKKILLSHEDINLDFEENGSVYFRLYHHGAILAEIVLKNSQMELECTSESDRIKVKKWMESILGDLVKHYRDEIVGID